MYSNWCREVGVGSVQDEAGWAVSDPERKRKGRKSLGSAGDVAAVRSPLAS